MTDTTRDLIQQLAKELDTWLMAHHYGGVPPEIQHAATLVAEARAYLAQPEPEGLTDEELNAMLYYEFTTSTGHGERSDPIGFARAVLARWGRPAIEPVPVSERLPGEGDCDSEGRCWLASVDVEPGWVTDNPEQCTNWTHWLPYHALPLPTTSTETP